ncbi:MAG: hypothetical protein ACYSU0_18875 [Planctomycetota bacterium]
MFDRDHVDYDVPIEDVFSAEELEVLRQDVPSLATMVEAALGRQDSIWGAKCAAYFKIDSVVPLLRHHLLTPRRCYGWEGPDYSVLESYLTDNQYQYSIAYLEAIEQITGRPIEEAVELTPAEVETIDNHAGNTKSPYHHWSLWLRRKFAVRGRPNRRVRPAELVRGR